jgi:hypothetical protein
MRRLTPLVIFLALLATPTASAVSTNQDLGLSYKNIQLFNKTSPSTGYLETNQNWFQADYLYRFERSYISGKIDAGTRINPSTQHFDVSLPEAYLSYTGIAGDKYILGRKVLDWNSSEKFWQLEHLNGQRSFNLMDDKQEGALGLMIDNPSGSFRSQFFISYFFVPTLTPHLDVENGNVITNSGWYKLPPNRANTNFGTYDLYFDVERPNSRDVFLHKSLGVHLSYAFSNGLSLSGYSLYKPEPRLRLNAAVEYVENRTAYVNTTAAVNHHFISGGEIKWEINENYTAHAGATYVDPSARLAGDFDSLTAKLSTEQKEFSNRYIKIDPKFESEFYTHASLSYVQPIYSLTVHGLKYLTNHDQGSDEVYSETTKWDTAGGLIGTYALTEQLMAAVQLRYDFVRKDNLLRGDMNYSPFNRFIIGMSLETLKAPKKESYWSPYRAQDTVTSYIKYRY